MKTQSIVPYPACFSTQQVVWAGGGYYDYNRVGSNFPTEKLRGNIHKLTALASLPVFTALPWLPKLPILMQALFCAHWEHSRSTQTHQGEETQEEHYGMATFKSVLPLIQDSRWAIWTCVNWEIRMKYFTRRGSGVSGETGGERAACAAARLCRPAEGRGRGRPGHCEAARDLRGGLWGSESRGHQDGRDHKEAPLRLYAGMSLSLVKIFCSKSC